MESSGDKGATVHLSELPPEQTSTFTPNEVKEVVKIPFTMDELINLFQKAPMGMHVNSGGQVLWANDFLLNLLGYEPSEYIGHKAADFMAHCDAEPDRYERIYKILQSGQPITNVRGMMFGKNGAVKHLVFDSAPVLNADGTFSHVVSFIRDDMETFLSKRALQEQLQHYASITKEKDRFIRIMFHEIRTPLHILSHQTTTLSNAVQGGKVPVVETIAIATQVDRCLGLVEDLSFAMMFERDQVLNPHPDPLNLRNTLGAMLHQAHIEFCSDGNFVQQTNKDTQFRVLIDEKLPVCVAVDRSLQRVLYNLITNAYNFCDNRGSVTVKVEFVEDNKNKDEENTSSSSPGVMKFSVTNSIETSLDLVYVNKLFQNYLHAHSTQQHSGATTPSSAGTPKIGASLSISQDSASPMSPTSRTAVVSPEPTAPNSPLVTQHKAINKSNSSSQSSAHLTTLSNTLTSNEGLGLGLFVSYNIIQSLGGMLECSTTHNEACFSFSLPVVAVPEPNDNSSKTTSKSHRVKNRDQWSCITDSAAGNKHVVNLRNKILSASASEGVLSRDSSLSGKLLSRKVDGSQNSGSRRPSREIIRNRPASRVLVVDDSPICRKVLIKSLEQNGFATDFACDGQEACDKLKLGNEIRTAAMEAGASSFISKPARLNELLAAMQEMLDKQKRDRGEDSSQDSSSASNYRNKAFNLENELGMISCSQHFHAMRRAGFSSEGAFANLTESDLSAPGLWMPRRASVRILTLADTIKRRLVEEDKGAEGNHNTTVENNLLLSGHLNKVAVIDAATGQTGKQFNKKADIKRAWEEEEHHRKTILRLKAKALLNPQPEIDGTKKVHSEGTQRKIDVIRSRALALQSAEDEDGNYFSVHNLSYIRSETLLEVARNKLTSLHYEVPEEVLKELVIDKCAMSLHDQQQTIGWINERELKRDALFTLCLPVKRYSAAMFVSEFCDLLEELDRRFW
eukprot:gene23867-30143_t